jgi:transcriptional regulator with XRE-family HTH domain
MKSSEIIKSIMKDVQWSQYRLAEEIGKKQSNITGILNRASSMRVDSLVELAEAMGYEVVIRNKQNGKQEYKVTDGR